MPITQLLVQFDESSEHKNHDYTATRKTTDLRQLRDQIKVTRC